MQTSRAPLDLRLAVGWSMGALAVAYWVLLRPYGGILHDALLYSLQSLAILRPESLGGDVFFGSVSQDSFTVFPHLWAPLISAIGLEDSARLLTMLGHALWIAAFLYLCRHFLPWVSAWTALAALAAMPGFYAAQDVFQIAEPFLTPRLYSEALSLLAIALTLRGRFRAAVVALAGAMACHPIMATGPAILCAYLALDPRNRWWVPSVIGLGVLGACAIAFFYPVYPLSRMDEPWWQLTMDRSPFLAIQGWDFASFREPLVTILTIWIFSQFIDLTLARRFLGAILLVAFLGFVVTLVGADLAKVALITQGQAWRWTWLTTALLPLAVVLGARTMWQAGDGHRATMLLVFSAWLLDGSWSIGLAALSLAWWHARAFASPGLARIGLLVATSLAAVSCLGWLTTLSQEWTLRQDYSWDRPLLGWIRAMCFDGQLLLLILAACLLALHHSPKSRRVVMASCLMIAMLSVSAAMPDLLRTDFDPLNQAVAADWRQTIPETEEVFWPSRPSLSWFVLERRHYVSATQSAGSVFSRDTTFELLERARLVSPILTPALVFSRSMFYWNPDSRLVRLLCAREGFRFFVSDSLLRGLVPAARPLTIPDKQKVSETFYLYDCEDLTQRI